VCLFLQEITVLIQMEITIMRCCVKLLAVLRMILCLMVTLIPLTPMCPMRHTSNLCVRYRKKRDSLLNLVFLCKLCLWVFYVLVFVKLEGLVSS